MTATPQKGTYASEYPPSWMSARRPSQQSPATPEQHLGHLAVGVGVEDLTAERVEGARVETGGHHDEIGREPAQGRDDHVTHREQVGRGARALRQWHVDVRAESRAGAARVRAPAAGRVELVGVQRDRQDRAVAVERVLGPVAVVHVPVHDRDALHPEGMRAWSTASEVLPSRQ